MANSRQVFLLSLALGTLIALIPLILKLRRDPFDAVGSYAIWWIGFCVVSAIMGFREPAHAKKVAQGVGLGLPTALVGYFIVRPESANLWPLSLIVATVVECRLRWLGLILASFLATFRPGRDDEQRRTRIGKMVFGVESVESIGHYSRH